MAREVEFKGRRVGAGVGSKIFKSGEFEIGSELEGVNVREREPDKETINLRAEGDAAICKSSDQAQGWL